MTVVNDCINNKVILKLLGGIPEILHLFYLEASGDDHLPHRGGDYIIISYPWRKISVIRRGIVANWLTSLTSSYGRLKCSQKNSARGKSVLIGALQVTSS